MYGSTARAILAGSGGGLLAVTPYTGTGAALEVSTSQPLNSGGLVWLKETGASGSHGLFDTARGVNKRIVPDDSAAETTVSGVSAFGGSGFTLGTNATHNNNGDSFIALSWLESASYFDVVTYTCGGGGDTVAHGLDDIPSMMIGKIRSQSTQFYIYHSSLGETKGLSLPGDSAAATNSGFWNDTSPNGSNFTTGYGGNGETAVMYLFGEKTGYSAFGTYTGTSTVFTNLSSLNAFLVKRTDAAGDWYLFYKDGGTWYHVKPNTTDARATGLISVSGGNVTLSGDASSGNGVWAAWR